ncbi:MAG: hypothetical protein EBZ77_04555 [Chitinophagia bacterium]|nr:hypothetical protein [Chitinophagia bacterium]
MQFERLELADRFAQTLGRLPKTFLIVVFGESGNGKTEFCLQLGKELARQDRTQWVAYETSHGPDLQAGVLRNEFLKYDIAWSNPWEIKPKSSQNATSAAAKAAAFPKVKDEHTNELFFDLATEILKKKSAKYWVIDSLDATGFSVQQWMWLWKKVGRKKGLILISHAKGKAPKTESGKSMLYYGEIGIRVHKYIAHVEKGRYGGFAPFIVYPEKAMELNPLFFGLTDKTPAKKVTKTKTRKRA